VGSLSPDESELLNRCIRRLPSAWEEFLSRYRDVLERAARATLLRVVGSVRDDDVEAVVEATLLAIVKDEFAALKSFAGRSSLAGYLQAIATKVGLNHLRTERRKGWLRFRPLDAAADAAAEEPTIEDPQRLAALQRALEQLPPRDRLILKLFHLDGAGYKEIAGLLGLSMNAVSPALIRARQKIRALLGEAR
jgi:RNA polymerase sigma-70 factor (ECF subfamily)